MSIITPELREKLNFNIYVTNNSDILNTTSLFQEKQIILKMSFNPNHINDDGAIDYIKEKILETLLVATTTQIMENPHDEIRRC